MRADPRPHISLALAGQRGRKRRCTSRVAWRGSGGSDAASPTSAREVDGGDCCSVCSDDTADESTNESQEIDCTEDDHTPSSWKVGL